MDTPGQEKTLLSLPVELQIYIFNHVKMTKDLVHARLVCRHINLLILSIVNRRLRSDLTSADGARCFIACNFRDPKWKEVGDLPRLAAISMEKLEFVIETPFIPRSLVNLVNTLPESDPASGSGEGSGEGSGSGSGHHSTSAEVPDLSMTNVFTDEFDCEMAIVLFSKDGRLRGAETLYDGELRFRPRYDSPSRRGSLTKGAGDMSSPTVSAESDTLRSTSSELTASKQGLTARRDTQTILDGAPRPEWEWRTDQSPSWIPCEAQPLPHTNRLSGYIRIDDVTLEYQLVPKDIVSSPLTAPSTQQPSSSSAEIDSTITAPTEPKSLTVIGIEIKKLIVNTGLVLRFLHNQLPEIQMSRIVRMSGPVLIPLSLFPTAETF
ncbi:hypothetical protein DFQ27_002812 [Actinomortierella ambigua]|uniref:F-box domain-containing protein n=1 Tax=Actinomortierella ambigua TaxID=1343610 RepID=A0A9P6QAC4_9FUNG|nr:hypothetical protein DFQ27_002812 [Actinomortierella ambigua]